MTFHRPDSRLALLCGSLAALTLMGTTARAQQTQQAETNSDLRCLVVSMIMSQSDDPGAKAIGQAGSAYYLGRVDGREPNADLEKRLAEQAKSLATGGGQADMAACMTALKTRASAVAEIVARVQHSLAASAGAAPSGQSPAKP